MEQTIPTKNKQEAWPRSALRAGLLRRLIDLTAAFWGLLFLSPLIAFIGMLIKRDSPGPVFYFGERVGKGGRTFRILKFRTMYAESASFEGPRLTAHDDPRITPIGQWLRDTKINELPQLWNVLKGEMSLVGPRPEDPEIIRAWPDEQRRLILSVKPGITSPASIVYRDEEAQLEAENVLDDYLRSVLPSKLRLDSLYIRNRSVLTDLDILFTTLYALIPRARAIPIPESRLYWGPFSTFFNRLASWFLIDLLVSLASVSVVAVIWRSITPLDIGWAWAPVVALVIAVAFSISNFFFDAHQVYWRKANPREALDLVVSTAVAVAILWLLDTFAVTAVDIPDGLFVLAGLTSAIGFIAVRYRERILTGLAWRWLRLRGQETNMGEPVVIVGGGELGQFATWLVRKSDLAQAFSIVGIVDDDPRKQDLRIDGVKVLGTTNELAELVGKYEPGLILYAISKISLADRDRILALCEKTGVQVIMIPDIIQMLRNHFLLELAPVSGTTRKRKKVSVAEVFTWLDELELQAAAGELDDLRERIEEIRSELAERVKVG